MNYRNLLIIFMLFLFSCTNYPIELPKVETKTVESFFSNKGFALIYNDDLYKQKIVSSKLQKRDLLVFQKNLKKNTKVKVTNLFNSKSIIAQVGKKAKYPLFYNSVVSERIASELEINKEEPYIEIIEIVNNSSFVAKTAKTFDEEKNVATKAPIDDIKIKDLSEKKENKKKSSNNQFIYIIKIGDFYFEKSAKEMKKRIVSETSLKNVNIKKITTRNYRVFLGPYKNLNSLKKSFNAISVLEFENLEIIKK